LADPTRLEENVSGGNIVMAVCNTNEEIVSYHKGGGGVVVEGMSPWNKWQQLQLWDLGEQKN
jgi:exosome complex RNA-binding protein Rrp42 (RNase PH superfamily)